MSTSFSARLKPEQSVPETVFRSYVAAEGVAGPSRSVDLADPATGRPWGTVQVTEKSVEGALSSAHDAYENSGWARMEGWRRAEVLVRLADRIVDCASDLALFESLATGKPWHITKAEVVYAARWYRYYAAAAEVDRDAAVSLSGAREAMIRREPLGVVAAITPFNGAFSLGSWKIAPALAAGNCIVVKPPMQSPASTLLLARLAVEAGVPAGVFNVVLGDAEEGQALAADPRVAALTFTGSTPVARRIGSTVAGRMGRFMCEAGGKSAHIVLDDADLSSAVIAATQGVFSGSGQTCVAGSRLLVQSGIYDEFLSRFVAHAERLVVGDPFDAATHLGPIATARQRDSIRGFVERAVTGGAHAALGGEALEMEGDLAGGFWIAPTILTDVRPEMEICREEVFGPVVAVQKVGSLTEALRVANDSQYGLAAGIWTTDAASAHLAAKTLQAGTVWINTYRGMDWRTPFGGYKQSGIGRENGLEAMHEFTQAKTVVQDFAAAVDPFGLE